MQYRSWQRTLDVTIGFRRKWAAISGANEAAFPASAVVLRAEHVALWRDRNKHRRYYANGCLALLFAAWVKGREWGIVDNDVSVKKLPAQPRTREITDAEFVAIRDVACRWLRDAMNIGYRTAPRPVDIRTMRWDQIVDDRLYMKAKKTGKSQLGSSSFPHLGLRRSRSRRKQRSQGRDWRKDPVRKKL